MTHYKNKYGHAKKDIKRFNLTPKKDLFVSITIYFWQQATYIDNLKKSKKQYNIHTYLLIHMLTFQFKICRQNLPSNLIKHVNFNKFSEIPIA